MRSVLGSTKRSIIAVIVLAAIALLVSQTLPPVQFFNDQSTGMLDVHLLLELFAIVISVLVVTVSFHSLDQERRSSTNLVIFGFSIVAGCDLAHALSYAGMPDFITVSSPQKTIFFWLMGRTFEAGTLALISRHLVLPGSRNLWLWSAIALGIAIFWLGTAHISWFPETFIPGEGITHFKTGYEYALAMLNVVTALSYWQQADKNDQQRLYLLAGSCVVMSMGNVVLASYRTPADYADLFGHVFKVVAYIMVYRAAYVFAIREPYHKLQASERKQREIQEQIRALSDNLPNGMVYQLTVTPEGTPHFLYVSANIKHLSMNSITADDVLRDASRLYAAMHADDLPQLKAAQQQSAKDMSVFNVVVRILHPDGGMRYLRLCSQPRRRENGQVVWDGIAIDVTERECIEMELRKLNLELEQRVVQRTAALTQANSSLESFSYMVAHDLRAPLRHIDGYAALLEQTHGQHLDDQGRKSLGIIRDSTATMNHLIDGILAMSRLEHGPLCIGQVDLSTMSEKIGHELKLGDPHRNVELVIQPGLHADADPVLIQNVLTNLLSNAWKFTASQSMARIEVGMLNKASQTQDDYYGQNVFFVRDNGIGFAQEEMESLFDLFQRHPAHAHVAGHGIGLASVRSIIANHGGKVWAEGAPAGGATFYFSLPIVQHPHTHAQPAITTVSSTVH